MKWTFLIALLLLWSAPSLVAKDEPLPDFAKGIPQTTFVEKVEINGNETIRLATPLFHKEFTANLVKFLGSNWSKRTLKPEDMMIAAQRGRALNAETNLAAYVGAKPAGVEILAIHFKPKDANLGPSAEITVIRPKAD